MNTLVVNLSHDNSGAPSLSELCMIRLGQASGHRQLVAVITNGHGSLGVMSLGRHKY